MAKSMAGQAHEAIKKGGGKLVTHQPGKSFGEAFSEKKAQFDTLQNSLSSAIMPSLPGQSAAKITDMGMGIDFHSTVTPPSPMMPLPHLVMVYDIIAAIFTAIDSVLPEPPEPPPAENTGGEQLCADRQFGNGVLF